MGSFVQKWPYAVILCVICVFLCCTYGLQNVHIETDIVKLWVSRKLTCT